MIFAQEVPKDAEVVYNDAVPTSSVDEPDTEVANLEKAVELFPTYFAELQRLGAVRIGQKRFDDAIEIFRRALAVNDRSFDCWYGMAYANYSTRKFGDAVASSEKAFAQKPDPLEAALLLGTAQRFTKDSANAEIALKKAPKLSEATSAYVHWQLALL